MAPHTTQRLAASALGLSRTKKRALVLAVDSFFCVATVSVTYWLRLDYWSRPIGVQWLSYILAIAFAVPIFIRFGLYRAIFRYAGWGAFVSVIKACALYGLAYSTLFAVIGIVGVPRTVGILQPVLLFIAVGATRWSARFWLGSGSKTALFGSHRRRVLVFGAGAAGRQLAAALSFGHEMRVIGFVDDDRTLQNNMLNGVPIYPAAHLADLIQELVIDDLLLAAPSSTRQRRRELFEGVQDTNVVIRTLPSMMDLAQGRVTVSDLRELDIDELLGRDTVTPDRILMSKTVAKKTVLISGAGGSIGSELCRQIMALGPTRILLVEQCEYNLYSIHRELEGMSEDSDEPVEMVPILASVLDEGRIDSMFAQWAPDTVYHAAAYKHVPLVELNPAEGLRNNVFGTQVMAQAAARHDVADFVLISTDKAVRPTNVMGASKRMAEQILQGLAASRSNTRFSMVRFGNVLGSSGSVVPLFRQQIKAGGPITITHAEISRYFMTIPEAAQLVIQAAAMADGGEVFVLDMGVAVRIIDLARRMIELSGLAVRDADNPDGDIEIDVIGIRPGEKLYEELLIGTDAEQTEHVKIMRANEPFLESSVMAKRLVDLDEAIKSNDTDGIYRVIKQVVPEYGQERVHIPPAPSMKQVDGAPLVSALVPAQSASRAR
mgnify:CR=1 FL=1